MKWFTPNLDDGFENVWSRREDPRPFCFCDAAVRQFVTSGKPVLMMYEFSRDTYHVHDSGYSFEIRQSHLKLAHPHGGRTIRQRVYYKPGAERRAARIVEMFETRAAMGLSQSAAWHAEMGWLFGYPVEEVEAFVRSAVDDGSYWEMKSEGAER